VSPRPELLGAFERFMEADDGAPKDEDDGEVEEAPSDDDDVC
jgi:hypothetical protein